MRFARIVDGRAYDCQDAPNVQELANRYHPDWLAKQNFVRVPDGTPHGSIDNGDGTFTPPVSSSGPTADITMSRRDLRQYIVKVFGGNGVGSAKLQSYIDDAVADTATTSSGQNRRFALEALRQEEYFTKIEAQQIMAALQFSAQDRASVLNSWPVVPI